MSDTDIVSTLCNVENNVDPTSKCWLGYLKKKKGNWKTILIHHLSNKITLEDSEENILSDDTLVSEELTNFFQNATKTLNINENSYIVDSSFNITDPVDKTINTYKTSPSILLIKQS